ncbi:MAG: hypothetical protein MUO82_00795 [Candidatus Thermoplasmatota archaeon]|nr:hypothetical protein [Candidatus Thermoplasmatota archaeon]
MDEISFIQVILGVATIICVVIIVPVVIMPYINRRIKFKEKHKEKLWKEILVKLVNIKPIYSNFSITLEVIDKEDTDEYKWTFQHLRDKHNNISMNFDLMNTFAEELNTELKSFEVYITQKIKNDLGNKSNKNKNEIKDDFIELLKRPIDDIIESLIKGNIEKTDDVQIKVIKDKVSIYVMPNKCNVICLSDIYNGEWYESFLLYFLKDNKTKEKLNCIKNKGSDIIDSNKRFKLALKDLIQKIENCGVDELKGKCDICSFWKDC